MTVRIGREAVIIVPAGALDAVRMRSFEDHVAAVAGGFTVKSATGGWFDNGKVWREAVYVYTVGGLADDSLFEAAKLLLNASHERAIYVRSQDGDAFLVTPGDVESAHLRATHDIEAHTRHDQMSEDWETARAARERTFTENAS